MTGHLLDTHYWLWFQSGDEGQISVGAREELQALQRASALYLSPISVFDLAVKVEKGRVDLGMSIDQFLGAGTRAGGLQLLPLTTEILIESTRLVGEYQREPDKILVATARKYGLTIITRDKFLLQSAKQGNINARKL